MREATCLCIGNARLVTGSCLLRVVCLVRHSMKRECLWCLVVTPRAHFLYTRLDSPLISDSTLTENANSNDRIMSFARNLCSRVTNVSRCGVFSCSFCFSPVIDAEEWSALERTKSTFQHFATGMSISQSPICVIGGTAPSWIMVRPCTFPTGFKELVDPEIMQAGNDALGPAGCYLFVNVQIRPSILIPYPPLLFLLISSSFDSEKFLIDQSSTLISDDVLCRMSYFLLLTMIFDSHLIERERESRA